MTVLRIRFDAPPTPTRAFAWALFDVHGVCTRTGHDHAGHWPLGDDKREAVLTTDLALLVAFKLPPLSPSRLEGAIRLQLEDRLATPLALQHVVYGAQHHDGWVHVTLLEHTLLDALRQLGIRHAISEAELIAATPDTWHWCVNEDGAGFVRRSDGGAFTLDLSAEAQKADKPPAELLMALNEAARQNALHIHASLSDKTVQRWQTSCKNCRLISKPVWQWTQADDTAWSQATPLLPLGETATPPAPRLSAGWRYATFLLGAALALHISATGLSWGAALWQQWQIHLGWQALAQEATLPVDQAEVIPTQWARAYANIRHQAGLSAPDDALPLMARAAPALRMLPTGALRNAVYVDRAWTLECTSRDTASQKTLEAALRRAGLNPMSGSSAAGYRLRIQAQAENGR